MTNILLWTAMWIFLLLVVLAFVVRGTKRRVLKEKQLHPYRHSREDGNPEHPESESPGSPTARG